jgi:peptidoglycan/LPS O-acetylase OafA/YrhL
VEFSWFYFSFLFDITVYLAFATILVFVLFNESRLRSFLRFGAVGFIGIIGYSVYLWHLPTLQILAKTDPLVGLTGWGQFIVLLALGAVLIFSISFVTYMMVERTFMKISHRAGKDEEPRKD